MNFSNKDITVFIFTRNRPDMVVDAVKSVLNQTAGSVKLYVLDNSTDEKTTNAIKAFPSVQYVKTDPSLPYANFKKLQSLADSAYTMVLHDDDLIHPQYVQLALEALNKIKDITYIGSKNTIFYNNDVPEEYKKPKSLKKEFYLLPNDNLFTLSFWSKPNSNWSSSIIKTECYKNYDIAKDAKIYGKTHDLSFLSQTMQTGGNAVIFTDGNILFYRNHRQSDSNDKRTALSKEQIKNLLKLFLSKSKTPHFLSRIYFLYSVYIAKQYFSAGHDENETQVFLKELLTEGIISKNMLLYDRRKQSLLLRLAFFPIQIFYKRNFWKAYLHKL